MKKVLSLNGIFNITNSLFESIKKNNPELIMEDNSSINIFDFKKRYKDATGLNCNPNGDEFDALMKVMEKTGGDPEKFQSELKSIFNKSDNNERNFKENLGKILKGKEIQDYRPKTNIKNQNNKKENERENFIKTIKGLIGEDNFNKLSYSELNNWFEKWNKKDNKGKEKIYSEIGKELEQRFFNNEKPNEDKVDEKPNEQPIEDKKDSIEVEEKPIEQTTKQSSENKNNNKDKIEEKNFSMIRGDYKKIERIFKNSFNGKWNMSENKFLTFVLSMFNNKYNGNRNKIEQELKKFYRDNGEELKYYIDNKNKNGLIDLFGEVIDFCKRKETNNDTLNDTKMIKKNNKENSIEGNNFKKNEEKPIEENNYKVIDGDIDDISRMFKNFLKSKKNLSSREFLSFIASLYNFIFKNHEEFVKKAMDKFILKYSNEYKRYFDDGIKDGLLDLFNLIKNECLSFYKKIQELEKNNKLVEAEGKKYSFDDLCINFINNGIESLKSGKEKRKEEFSATKEFKNGNSMENIDSNSIDLYDIFTKDNIEDEELKKRIISFISEYITDDTLNIIKGFYTKLSDKNILKYNDDKISNGYKCLENVVEKLDRLYKINEGIDFKSKVKLIREANIDDNIENNNEKNTIDIINANKKLLNAKCIILGYDESKWDEIKNWFGSAEDKNLLLRDNSIWNKLLTDNNLLKWLSDSSWNKIEKTFDIPIEGNTPEEKEKNADLLVKHFKNVLENYLFKTKIPPSIVQLEKNISDNFNWQTFGILYVKIYEFGDKILGFMRNNIKKDYIDTINNANKTFLNMKLMKFLKPMNPVDFCKNVKVYYCRSEKGFNLINNAIRESLYNRNEWKVGFEQIRTNLDARTYLYKIEYTDNFRMEKDNKQNIDNILNNIKSINGLKISTETLRKYDKRLMEETPKIYYIIVTEGLIKKGQFLKNLGGFIKKIGNNGIEKDIVGY